jgi:hypothetical protein
MTDFDRSGAIDDPGGPGGPDVTPRTTPPGDSAGNTGAPGEPPPSAADLDLPGPDDPVAWRYVDEGTAVIGPDGSELGSVAAMLGSDQEDIFHGVAVRTGLFGEARIIAADDVVRMTPSRIDVRVDGEALERAETWSPPTS